MKCSNARKITYLSEYPEVVSQDMLEAKRHTKECRECSAFLDAEKSFGPMLRSAIKKDSPPEELKNKILSAGEQKKRYLKRPYQILAVAASILIISVVGYLYSTHTKAPTILNKIVNDHVKFLPVPQMHIGSSNSDEVTAWFRSKVNFAVIPPSLNARLKGGRLCILDKRHFALLFYEYNGSPVSVFITDEAIPDDLKSKKEVMLKDKRAYVLNKSGYIILLWADRGLMYSIVSELDAEKTKNIF